MTSKIHAAIALSFLLALASKANAADVRSDGVLKTPPAAPLMTLCTDYTMQKILSDDIWSAKRNPPADAPLANIVTVTVTLNQYIMKPGVSLNDVAGGDAKVLAILKGSGLAPVPSDAGDAGMMGAGGGSGQMMPGAMGGMMPGMMGGMMPGMMGGMMPGMAGGMPGQFYGGQNYGQPYGQNFARNYGKPSTRNQPSNSPLFGSSDDQAYNKVLVAHVTLSTGTGAVSLVAILEPQDDVNSVKKLMAEKIANSLLH